MFLIGGVTISAYKLAHTSFQHGKHSSLDSFLYAGQAERAPVMSCLQMYALCFSDSANITIAIYLRLLGEIPKVNYMVSDLFLIYVLEHYPQ